jgi:dienelactone hydrolase
MVDAVMSRALLVLLGVLLTATPVLPHATDTSSVEVSFPSIIESSPRLTGRLYRPDGPGPFPSLVMLHGCAGISTRQNWWAETLRSWGYLTLAVDSFGPRGESIVCDTLKVDPQHARVGDTYAGRAYLAAHPLADKERIGLIGWSHGGTTTLYVVDDVYLSRLKPVPFKTAVAFYPGCLMRIQRLNAPLLILIGEEDDWTPAARCQRMELEPNTRHGITLRVYPGAHHGFDGFRPVGPFLRHTVGRDPGAAAKAVKQVEAFLVQHLAPAR